MTGVPAGWVEAKLGEVVSIEYGKGLTAKQRVGGTIPVFASAGQVGWHDTPLTDGPLIVIGRKGAAGAVTVSDGPAWIIDTAYYAAPSPELDIRFLAYQLEAANLRALDQSTAIPSLSRDALRQTRIVLAPLAVQTEVVQRIDELQSLVDEAAVEVAACSSVITQFEAAVRASATDAGSSETALDELATIQSGITKAPPKSDSTALIPYLRTANVQAGFLDLNEIKTIAATSEQVARHQLKPGDVLVIEGGDADKVGRGWIWSGEIEPCLHQNHVFAVRPDPKSLDPRFLAHLINAPQARSYFAASAKQTTNLASINKTQLRGLPVPLLTLEEQGLRVSRLERALGEASELRRVIKEIHSHSTALRRSILHQAFFGALTDIAASPSESEKLAATLRDAASSRTKKPRAEISAG